MLICWKENWGGFDATVFIFVRLFRGSVVIKILFTLSGPIMCLCCVHKNENTGDNHPIRFWGNKLTEYPIRLHNG